MPFEIGRTYARAAIQAEFPGLGDGAVAAAGQQVALVLKRENRPGFWNAFEGSTLLMEVGHVASRNALLRDRQRTKILFWSEDGGEYTFLGPIQFLGQDEDRVLRRYVFQILDPAAPVPPR